MKYQLMFIRIVTAAILFLLLAQANTWADTQTHLVLAVGYRAFLLAAPLFLYFGLSNGMRLSIGVGVVSLIFAFFSFNTIAVGCFALSMAVSGYISKYVNSHSSQGAADNKVALNIGSLLSGLLVMLTTDKDVLIPLAVVALFAAGLFAMKIDWNKAEAAELPHAPPAQRKPVRIVPLIGWSLVGVATGIKLTGVFTILPQYLLHVTGQLPSWFGALIILNSLGVIFVQHRVLVFLDRSKRDLTLFFSLSAMTLLALPAVMHVDELLLAVLWVVLLTLGECALSRYDRLAKEDGYLFPKEVMVGAGSFLTVALSRDLADHIYLSGLIGFVCMLLGIALTRWNRTIAREIVEARDQVA